MKNQFFPQETSHHTVKRIAFLIGVLLISIFFLIVKVSAAVNIYTVTGGNPASLPAVGGGTVTLPTITLTEDGTADDFLSDPEAIRVIINSTNYENVLFDQTMVYTDITVGGTCGYSAASNTDFAFPNNYTIQFKIINGTSCAAGETITIDGLRVKTVVEQAAPGAFALVSVDNYSTSPGTPVSTSDNVNLASTAAAANASVTLTGNSAVGGTGDTTLTLTIPNDLEINDRVVFTMPNNINVLAVSFSSETFDGLGTFSSCSAAGQIITCTSGGGITAGTGNIVMTNITPYYGATGQTVTSLEVQDNTYSLKAMAKTASASITDTTATDAAASVTLATNSVVNATDDTTLNLSLGVSITNLDTVVFTMPNNLDVSSAAFDSETFAGGASFTGCAPIGQIITCTVDGGGMMTAGAGTIVMTGIKARYAATDQTVTSVTVNDVSAGGPVSSDSSGTVTDTAASDASASIALNDGSHVVGAGVNMATLSLTIGYDLASGDTVVFTMPSNLNVSGVTFDAKTFGGAGTFSECTAIGQVVTCTSNGVISAGAGTIRMTQVLAKTAGTGRTVTNVAVNDTSAGGADISSDASGTVADTVASDAAATLTLANNYIVGTAGSTSLNLTLGYALEAGDTVVFTMPNNLDVSGVEFSAETFGGLGSFSTCTDALQVITCTTDGAISAGAGTIIMTGILSTSAATGQSVTTIAVNDVSEGGEDISYDASGTVTDTIPDANASIALDTNSTVGTTGNTVLTLTLPTSLAINDTIVFTMPNNLNVASLALNTESFAGDGTFTSCSAVGQVVTCTSSGAITAGTGTITMTGVIAMYTATGQTISDLVVNDDSNAGADITADVTVSVTDTAAKDANANVTLAGNSAVGGTGNTTLTLTVGYALATGDTVIFTMPNNLDVSSVAFASTTLVGGGTFSSCGSASQIITCTVNGAISAGSGDIVMTSIKAKYAATGQTVTGVAINDTSNGGADISSDASGSVTTDTTAATTLTATFDASSVTTVGDSTGQVTLGVTFPVALASSDTIKMTFPANYAVSSLTTGAGKDYGLSSTVTVAKAGQAVTLTLSGAQAAGADTINFEENTITPGYALTGQNITVLIEKSSGEDVIASALNTGVNVSVNDTIAGNAVASVTLDANSVMGVAGNTTLNLTIPFALAANDTVVFTLPDNLDVTGLDAATTTTFTGGGAFACVATLQVITCTTNGVITAGTEGIVMTGIIASTVATGQTITSVSVNDVSASGADIATDASGSVTDTVVGALSVTSLQPSVFLNGASTNITAAFTTPGTVAANYKIKVTFPSTFNVNAAANGTCSTMNGSFATSTSGQVVIITRSGGSAQPAAAETCTFNNIVNPSSGNSSGTFIIQVTDAANTVEYHDTTVAAYAFTGSTSNSSSSSSSPSTVTTTNTIKVQPDETQEPITQQKLIPRTLREILGSNSDKLSAQEENLFINIKNHWAYTYIRKLYRLGVLQERDIAEFTPDKNVTRAEMVKIAVLTFGLPMAPNLTSSFSDVKPGDWFAQYVTDAEKAGIIRGYENGTFRPNDPVNRVEALKILFAASGHTITNAPAAPFDDVPQTEWYAKNVNFAFQKNIIGGKTATTFAPAENVTQAEMTKIAVLLLEL